MSGLGDIVQVGGVDKDRADWCPPFGVPMDDRLVVGVGECQQTGGAGYLVCASGKITLVGAAGEGSR